ncbi:nucleotidyltransferase substrate binding protein [Geomesophilobacter sediminis]|uniref:Nucleotidyltransferase substrate binding protein n=1 Tax=Geomesophilobacter sediminis TaxID=2798584 RepID=A0A8J7LXQ0_9BACT|nr:nucleotidyltransferase substrate binding protein [Geomesophilobacter sediminis]MBJ6723496.1 nucleotidyltransferase substrate binding protein [Geomesophilobacter sediminis]
MNDPDIRWRQRYQHFSKALTQLGRAVDMSRQRALNEIEQQGLIKAFEFTHELAWNVLKDYFEYQGIATLIGSRDASREAFQRGLVDDGEGWMEMIRSRNMTSHTYNEDVANEIAAKVVALYYPLFCALHERLAELMDAE